MVLWEESSEEKRGVLGLTANTADLVLWRVWREGGRVIGWKGGWYENEKAHCQILSLSPKEQRQAPQHLPQRWLWHLSMLLWLKRRPDDPVWTPIIWLAHLGGCPEMKLSFVPWFFHYVSLSRERFMCLFHFCWMQLLWWDQLIWNVDEVQIASTGHRDTSSLCCKVLLKPYH